MRRALQADETDIAGILNRVSLSDVDREAVIALEGDEAQSFLNVVQDVSLLSALHANLRSCCAGPGSWIPTARSC